jgi:hypothetical protein
MICSDLITLYIREMLGALLVFSWCHPNCDVLFKITNRLKVNNDNLKFNGNFKSHITVGRNTRKTLEKNLAFPYILFFYYYYFFNFFSPLPTINLLEAKY